jgi:hypothetical protein
MIPAYDIVSKLIILSFRSEARNLIFNNLKVLRFLTYVRNDISYYAGSYHFMTL